jgi:hypothetical protein
MDVVPPSPVNLDEHTLKEDIIDLVENIKEETENIKEDVLNLVDEIKDEVDKVKEDLITMK